MLFSSKNKCLQLWLTTLLQKAFAVGNTILPGQSVVPVTLVLI